MKNFPDGLCSHRPRILCAPRIAALLSLLTFSICNIVSAQPALTNYLQISGPVASGTLIWGDADKDDDLDLWIVGSSLESGTYRSTILRNDRNGVLSATLGQLTMLNRCDAVWIDFDRDGDLDGITCGNNTSGNPSTAVWRNDLPSAFTSVVLNRPANLGDSAIAVADADGDGDEDVLICGTTSSSSRQTSLYINTGGGSFSNSLMVLPGVSQGAVAWADFDGDGDQDFVLTGTTNGSVSGAISILYRNDGTNFTALAIPLPAVYRSAVAWADYDCDGDPDLLISGASASGPVTVLMRNDNGTFTQAATFPGVADGALAWGDADQDGYPDLAMSGRLSNGSGTPFSGFYWNRTGVFTNSLVDLPQIQYSAMAWGDLDYDGQLDLALAGSTNGNLSWGGDAITAIYRNTVIASGTPPPVPVSLNANVQGSGVLLSWQLPGGSPGGLSYDVRVGTAPGGIQIMSPAADLANGFRRLAQPGEAGWSKNLRLRNLPAGTYYWSVQSVNPAYKGSAFATEGQFTILNSQPTVTAIAAQNMPMNSVRGPLALTINDAETDPSLLTVSAVSSNPTLFPPGSVVLGGSGMNRDATFTPAINQSGTATIVFTVSDPDGGSTTTSARITVTSLVDAAAPFPNGQFSIIEPGDVNGDGTLDMLIAGNLFISAGTGQAYVRLFLNAGDGTFSEMTPNLPPVFNGAFAAWGDYDNDGDLDLFYAGNIYRNDSGTFTLVSSPAPNIEQGQAAWGDYDGDGDLDLAITGGVGSSTFISEIFRNDGNDTFTLISAPLQGLWYSSIAWADVDGDGDLDLAIAGAAAQNTTISPNLRVYRNDGGQFVEALSLFGAASAKLTWGDVNGDGRPDLVVTGVHGTGTGSAVNDLYINLGGWQFTKFSLLPGGSDYTDTKLLDWDHDGDLDLLGGVNSIVSVFGNPGTGEFSSSPMATVGVRCSALRWGDFDNDSDFDVFVENIGTVSASGTNLLYLNPIANNQPTPPLFMTNVVAGNSVTLSWPTLAPINNAPVTYNLRVGTAPGLGDVLVPHSRTDGRRLIPVPGNAGFANRYVLNQLPPGTYWWTVQAVDNRWHGQPWETQQSFTITSPLRPRINSLELLSAVQSKVKFTAQPGRTVTVQSSTNLTSWNNEAPSVPVGLSGNAESTPSASGDKTFYRVVQPN